MFTHTPNKKNKSNLSPSALTSGRSGKSKNIDLLSGNLNIEAKLTIGQPNDKYEQEADRVADHVMRTPEDAIPDGRMPANDTTQRSCSSCGEEENVLQTKPLYTQISPLIQCQPIEEEEGIQAKSQIQKQPVEEEEELQAKVSDGQPIRINTSIENGINREKGNGQLLPSKTREFMENRFGVDFGKVNVHTDANASEMNQELGAKAFTVGNDVYFNENKYNPNSIDGKHLLAHELTHTVQQGSFSKSSCGNVSASQNGIVQKDDETESTAEIQPEVVTREATEAERREFVQIATTYLQEAGSFFQEATIDASTLDRVLEGWKSTLVNNGNIINTYLNSDATLLQNLKAAYTASLRILMTRASAQLNVPLIQLYLQKMHLIPEWAWPGTSDFNLTTDDEKGAFIEATTASFNDVATFAGFTTLDEATVTDILTRLKNLVNDQLEIITGDLGNDQTLRDNLHNAYQVTLNAVLTAAAPQMGQSVTQLSVRFMDLIPEGMENFLVGTSTPVPLGTTPDASGNTVFMVNGIEVTIVPDSSQSGAGAKTNITPHFGVVSWQSTGGSISSFSGVATPPAVEIRTNYNASVSPITNSAYGRGTTQTDQERGNTSLGFHESRHGLNFISFMRDNAPPVFSGAVGDSVADFQTEVTRWDTAKQDYIDDMGAETLSETDCVGTTLDDHNTSQGNATNECAP
jgi:hypothetical protein